MIVINKLRSDGLENPQFLTAYVQQTAKYRHIGWLRGSAAKVELKDGFDDEPSNEATPSAEHELAETQRVVSLLIEKMPVERDREILFRFYVLAQTKPLICDALDLSKEHFDRVIDRARKRFRELWNLENADAS